MKNITILTLFVLVLMQGALAQVIQTDSFGAEFKEVDKTIFPGQVAIYDLTIDSYVSDPVRFQLSTIDPQYIISSNPPVGSPMISNQTYEVLVQPVTDIAYGPRIFDLKLSNIDTGDKITFSVPITIQDPDSEDGVYVASVLIDIDMERELDPRDGISATIDLTNRNGRNLDPVKVYVQATNNNNEILIDQTFQAIIGPWKQKSQELRWTIDPLQEAGNYKLKVVVEFNDEVIQEKEKTFIIQGYNDVAVDAKNSFKLLDAVNEYTVTNNGNQEVMYNLTKSVNWFERLFLTSSNDFIINTDEGRQAVVTLDLQSEESQTVRFVVHWNYLAIFILVVVLGLLGYYKLRNPVISIKEILLEHTGKNISEAKVRLFVRNRSNKVLNNIRIMDKVPPIADVMNAERLGTLQPSKINATKTKGTLIKWELNSLEPYEERIITYKIKSKLEIVGGMSLPPAKIVFEEKEGKERQAFSSNAKL